MPAKATTAPPPRFCPGRHDHDERGSIVIVMTILITASILILLAAGVAVSQVNIAQRTMERNDALQAAESGLDAAVGQIRAANDGSGNGVLTELPCNNGNGFTLTGSLGVPTGANYNDKVIYLSANPQGNTSNTTWINANDITCSGTHPTSQPSYALIAATGADTQYGSETVPQRTIDETYLFQTTNANIAGGLIYDYQATYCLTDDDTSGSPSANDTLEMELCAPGNAEQTWAYRSDWTIVLTSTETSSYAGLCITESGYSTMSLQTCSDGLWTSSGPTTTPSYTQQWGVDDNGGFEPVASNGDGDPYSDPNGDAHCVTTEDNPPEVNDSVSLATCTGGFTDNQTWYPSAAVGAGDSGATTTQQFVNFEEFGRCIDITNQDPTDGYNQGAGPGQGSDSINGPGGFLIDYMCKQFPNTSAYPAWNQRFNEVATTYNSQTYYELQSTSGGTTYCLWSPLDTVNLTGSGTQTHAWAEVQPCSTATLANIVWTVNTNTGSATTSYTIQDSAGNCVEANLADQQQPGGNGDAFSTIALASCDGSNEQKWNAPPTLADAATSNAFEPAVSGG